VSIAEISSRSNPYIEGSSWLVGYHPGLSARARKACEEIGLEVVSENTTGEYIRVRVTSKTNLSGIQRLIGHKSIRSVEPNYPTGPSDSPK
jgi:hypothetical protein